MRRTSIIFLICFVHTAFSARDFFMGMFRRNDFLVAADEVYKPKVPSRFTWAQYGRVFKCPITYFRVVDRLGSNVMPRVEILKGGLRMKYIVIRLSVYNRPISVNIFVGCENKQKFTLPKRTQPSTTDAGEDDGTKDDGDATGDTTADGGDGTGADGDGATTGNGGAGAEGGAGEGEVTTEAAAEGGGEGGGEGRRDLRGNTSK